MMLEFCSTLTFRGMVHSYAEYKNPQVGDMIIDSKNTEWIYVGDGWERIEPVVNLTESLYPKEIHVKRTHCKSCGAPLDIPMYPYSNLVRCEYCGSTNNIEVAR